MTPEEAIIKFDNIINSMDAWILEALQIIALDAFAIVVNRIHQDGLPGRQYSANELPTYYFEGKELNAGGRALLNRKDKKAMRKGIRYLGGKVRKNDSVDRESDGISYRDWRIANGLQVAHVDLSFTGNMFRSMKLIKVAKMGDDYIVSMYSDNPETNTKLKANARRYGLFLALTNNEKRQLANRFKEMIQNKMQEAFK